MRLRAADQLGELHLPNTGESLARVGANLSAPRDATKAIRDAFAKVGRYASHDARFSRPSALRSSVGTSHC